MISYKTAKRTVLNQTVNCPTEQKNVLYTTGRVLAQDVISKDNIPCFNRSAMDGYAVKADDLRTATEKKPVLLKLRDTIPAGKLRKTKLSSGETIQIATGALIPNRADAVVMMEEVKIVSSNFISFTAPVKSWENIAFKGEDVKADKVVIKKGKVLTPGDIGMIAALGYDKIKVEVKPRVYILSTGDEVVPITDKLKKGKVRDSNSYSIYSAVSDSGGEPVRIGIVKDNIDSFEKVLKKIKGSITKIPTIVIITGGVSVGAKDYVKQVLIKSGVRQQFWQVATKPGKPIFFGTWEIENKPRTLVFGLPGYPVSSLITFELYVRPVIKKMLGATEISRQVVVAELKEPLYHRSPRREFVRAVTVWEKNGYYTRLTGTQKAGVLSSMVLANSLIEVPENVKKVDKGKKVQVWLLK